MIDFQEGFQEKFQEGSLVLRRADMVDSKFLFELRSDPLTLEASYDSDEFSWDSHNLWVKNVLADSNRKLFVVEVDTAPVGMVRADYAEGGWELSWSVAPKARGLGIAKKMVLLLSKQIDAPIRAEVKITNGASARVAEFAGMVKTHEAAGILYYQRD